MKKGYIYRIYRYYSSNTSYADVVCTQEDMPFARVLYTDDSFYFKKGAVIEARGARIKEIAKSIFEYSQIMSTDALVITKEVRIKYYNDTIIDKLYNWYCKFLKRITDDYV